MSNITYMSDTPHFNISDNDGVSLMLSYKEEIPLGVKCIKREAFHHCIMSVAGAKSLIMF